jgi:hypothetical protein
MKAASRSRRKKSAKPCGMRMAAKIAARAASSSSPPPPPPLPPRPPRPLPSRRLPLVRRRLVVLVVVVLLLLDCFLECFLCLWRLSVAEDRPSPSFCSSTFTSPSPSYARLLSSRRLDDEEEEEEDLCFFSFFFRLLCLRLLSESAMPCVLAL